MDVDLCVTVGAISFVAHLSVQTSENIHLIITSPFLQRRDTYYGSGLGYEPHLEPIK